MARMVNVTEEQKAAFSAAMRAAMATAGITKVSDLARRGRAAGIERTGETFNTWVNGSEPSRGEVLALEVLLDQLVDRVLREAGVFDQPGKVTKSPKLARFGGEWLHAAAP